MHVVTKAKSHIDYIKYTGPCCSHLVMKLVKSGDFSSFITEKLWAGLIFAQILKMCKLINVDTLIPSRPNTNNEQIQSPTSHIFLFVM